jgi:hypothetical protein
MPQALHALALLRYKHAITLKWDLGITISPTGGWIATISNLSEELTGIECEHIHGFARGVFSR